MMRLPIALPALMVGALLLTSCGKPKETEKSLPRVAIAGLAIESSTFSPAQTEEAAFHAEQGDSVLNDYPFMAADSGIVNRAQWFPALVGMRYQAAS